MKLLSTLAVFALLVSLPALATEPTPTDLLDLGVEEISMTLADLTSEDTEIDVIAIGEEEQLTYCNPDESNFCETSADCPPACYCHPIGNCCE